MGIRSNGATYWPTPGNPVDISHASNNWFPLSISGNQAAGYGALGALPSTALLWNLSPPNYDFVSLNPSGADSSRANATDGTHQVGLFIPTGGVPGNATSHAVLWTATAVSAVDLNLPGAFGSGSDGVSGGTQVGFVQQVSGGPLHAALWHGTAVSFADLNPTGFAGSEAVSISGGQIVGYALQGTTYHAALWTAGTPDSFVDLQPAFGMASRLFGTNGLQQAGIVSTGAFNYQTDAVVWGGTASSAQVLPLPGGYSYAAALGIDAQGDIVGSAITSDGSSTIPVMWTPIPEPTILAALPLAVVALRRRHAPVRRACTSPAPA